MKLFVLLVLGLAMFCGAGCTVVVAERLPSPRYCYVERWTLHDSPEWVWVGPGPHDCRILHHHYYQTRELVRVQRW